MNHDPSNKQETSSTTQTSKRHHVRRRSYYPSTIRIILGHFASLTIFLFRQLFRSNNLPFLLTFLWHTYYARRLLRLPRTYLKRYFILGKRDPPPVIAIDVLQRLGGINLSLGLLALLALIRFRDMTTQKVTLLVLSVANGAQAWNDVINWRSGRWNWNNLAEIGGSDGTIALMNIVAYCISVLRSGSLL
ncbi:14375_t:CDS:1 [Cetraspora pellucida]|uniref:14375_t:CDS:1 n=1 Tax=Cetraspora pellucida TaxID=1433469 RepID=A0ACA9R3I8_9GLOM|nr:14375_t:CDS:1 [Cetraspora pellucida]